MASSFVAAEDSGAIRALSLPRRRPEGNSAGRYRERMPKIELAAASWTDVRDHVAGGDTIAFLPFGALEQHGPHLPLSTDTIQCTELASRLADHYPGLLLPPVPYGET